MVKAGQHRCFLAEIAGEFQQRHWRARMILNPGADAFNGCVGRSIVNQHQLIHTRHCQHALHKTHDHLLFVETGRDDPDTL